jgi:hypothetical protein
VFYTFGVALLIVAWSFSPLLFEGHSLYTDDVRHYHTPMLQAWIDAVGHGRLPLWTDHSYFGFPLIADPQVATFYPGTPLLAWLGPEAGYVVLAIVHFVLAAAGSFWLTRSFGASRPAAAISAIVVSHCGFFANEIQHPGLLAILCWMPWWWWTTRRLFDVPSRGRGLALAAVVALMLFAGTLQVLLGGLVFYAFLVVGMTADVWVRKSASTAAMRLLAVAGANLLGLALAAVVIAPAVAHLPLTARALGMTYEFAAMGSLHANDLIGLALNGYAAQASATAEVGAVGRDFSELSFYLGVATLPLAIAGLASLERRFALAVVVGLAVLIALGMGRHGSLHPWLFEAWPGVFAGFRGMSRALGPVSIALAFAAGFGADRIARAPAGERRAWFAAGVGWLALLGACAMVGPTSWSGDVLASWGVAAFGLVVLVAVARVDVRYLALAVAAIVGIDLVGFGPLRSVLRANPLAREAQAAADEVAALQFIAGGSRTRLMLHGFGPVNLPLRNGVDGVGGYNPLVPLAYLDYVSRVNGGRQFPREPIRDFVSGAKPQRFGSPLFDAGAIEYVVSNRHDRVRGLEGGDASRVGTLAENGAALYVNPGAVPRVYVAYRSAYAKGPADLDGLLGGRFAPHRMVVVEGDGPVLAGPAAIRPVSSRATRPERRHLEFEHDTPGVLVVVDAFHPGWKATVNDVAAPVFRVNGMFRGVEVPAGKVRVEMEFAPAAFTLGAATSLAALCAAVGIVALPLVRRGRSHE